MDLGWIWVGYIQDGPLGPFGPTGIAPGGLQGGQKWPKNAIKRALGISRQAKKSQLTTLDVKYNVQPSLTDVQPI